MSSGGDQALLERVPRHLWYCREVRASAQTEGRATRAVAGSRPVALPWLSDHRGDWLVDVERWVTRRVADLGLGDITSITLFRERRWGVIFDVRTSVRRLFFKAIEPTRRHEVRITEVASAWPNLAPDVLAADEERLWLLMADHGIPIRDSLDPIAQVDAIASLLPAYAHMQASTTGNVAAWLADGAPDRRVHQLPAQLDAFLSSYNDPRRVACGERLPAFHEACDLLAASPIPDALDHADLHGTNVLFDGTQARVIDWGDCCITHPFSTLFVTFSFVLAPLEAASRATAARQLRDLYLEPWGGSTPENVRLFDVAVWVAHVTRALGQVEEGTDDADQEVGTLLDAWLADAPVLRS